MELESLPRIKRETIPAKCSNCQKDFNARKRTRLGKPAAYCSRKCFHDHVKETGRFKGDKSWHWRGGISLPSTENNMRYYRRQESRQPERVAARRLLVAAVKAGKLVRGPCETCGTTKVKTEGHHDDYSQPLAVRWLCPPCHDAHHAAERVASTKGT